MWPFGKPKKLTEEQVVKRIQFFLEAAAKFADQHDVIVPKLTVSAYGVEIGLTMARLKKDEKPEDKIVEGK